MYHLSVVNRTDDILAVTLDIDTHDTHVINPSCSETLTHKTRTSTQTLKFWNISVTEKGLQGTEWSASVKLPRRKAFSRYEWDLIKGEPTLPFTAYRRALTKKHHQLVVFPIRSLSSFLADMPSHLPLSSLMLPGTHNSVAFFGWPVSQCQNPSTPLSCQFSSGIRVLDIRLSIINGVLLSYHGIYPQKLPFLDILKAVHIFLTSPAGKTETIVLSVKQEDQASLLFSQLVQKAVYNGPGGRDMWFLENRIPTLGEVRGKVVLFSRFGDGEGWENGLEGLGIHPTTWPDSSEDGFEWWLKGTQVKTHDWYDISNFLAIPEKASRASSILLQPSSSTFPTLSIAFLSASSLLALPQLAACGFGWPSWGFGVEGVNSRVGKWVLGLLSGSEATHEDMAHKEGYFAEPRLRGWCLMDYFKEPTDIGLVRLLVECNYRGRQGTLILS
ncbi:PLC-like phosphodiesterase [Ramaria rubella]|nr:PLC-like phosphodiesterase [Ramaria rubella]